MSKQHSESDRRLVNLMLGIMLAISAVPATATAGAVFTWEPAGPSSEFTADGIQGVHYLWDVGSMMHPYTVEFLEQITGFTLNGAPVATPGLNGAPGAPAYGLYFTMENQTKVIEPSNPSHPYQYLSGQSALWLDPGYNNGAPSSDEVKGLTFANVGPLPVAGDVELATGSLVSGHFTHFPVGSIVSIGNFLQTFRPTAAADGFFVTLVSPNELIQLIDTTFVGDLKIFPDPTPSDPGQSISRLNGGKAELSLHVPEPASFLLLGAGLAGLAASGLRKNDPRPR